MSPATTTSYQAIQEIHPLARNKTEQATEPNSPKKLKYTQNRESN